MGWETVVDGVVLESFDIPSRTVTIYDRETGEVTGTRPFTPDENANADRMLVVETEEANRLAITSALESDLAAMQAIIDQTNADLRADPAQEIKDIARAIRRIDRMLLRDFTGTG